MVLLHYINNNILISGMFYFDEYQDNLKIEISTNMTNFKTKIKAAELAVHITYPIINI